MGVKLDFFCCVGAELQDFKFGQETNSRLYFYRAFESQTIDDMLEPGFFNEAQDLRVGDLILLYAPNQNRGYAFARVISTMDGIVSTQSIGLKAQDVAVDTDELDNLTGENLQKIIEIADAKITELNTNKADKTTDFQTPITSANKGATMAEITPIQQDIDGLKGAGGALTAYNFNTATPTQETLTKYAVDQIWPGNTNWAWNVANPAASTFTDVNGVLRTAAEIFNSTWVNNTYDDHRWQLTNTQNTAPKVFEWADVGRDIVAVATATTAGIVRVGDGSQMAVNPITGDISLNASKASEIRDTIGAIANNQGAENAGKVMTVGGDGNLVPTPASASGLPIGAIVQYCGDTVPDKFMWCDGSAISRTTYASLFAVIGTKYGEGDGSTTYYNLPNFNSAVPWAAPDWDRWQELLQNTNVTLPYDGYLLVNNTKGPYEVTIWYSGRQLMKFTPASTTDRTNSRTMLIPFRQGDTIRVDGPEVYDIKYYKLMPTPPTEKWIIKYI